MHISFLTPLTDIWKDALFLFLNELQVNSVNVRYSSSYFNIFGNFESIKLCCTGITIVKDLNVGKLELKYQSNTFHNELITNETSATINIKNLVFHMCNPTIDKLQHLTNLCYFVRDTVESMDILGYFANDKVDNISSVIFPVLPQLQKLFLTSGLLKPVLEFHKTAPYLETLELGSLHITQGIATEIYNLKFLKNLWFCDCNIEYLEVLLLPI